MILDISYRTDIPAFYGGWLYNRFQEGYLYQRNPIATNKISKIKLDNTIDAIIFCSKNYIPFMKYINYFEQNWRCMYQYTITSYQSDIEPNVPTIQDAINNFIELSKIVGKDKIIWRYDPILCNEKYDLDWHKSALLYMCEQLSPYTNTCIFSFISTIYPNVKRNIPDLIDIDKDEILSFMEDLSKDFNIMFQTCGHGIDYIDKYPLIKQSGCQTTELLESSLGIKFKKSKLGNKRPGCLCIDAKSIGDYNTCLNGCKYCYASRSSNIKGLHYKYSQLLIGCPDKNDIITEVKQESLLDNSIQLELGF